MKIRRKEAEDQSAHVLSILSLAATGRYGTEVRSSMHLEPVHPEHCWGDIEVMQDLNPSMSEKCTKPRKEGWPSQRGWQQAY